MRKSGTEIARYCDPFTLKNQQGRPGAAHELATALGESSLALLQR
jgi:hypothetical protein